MYQKDEDNAAILPLLESVITDITKRFPDQIDSYWSAMMWIQKMSRRDSWWSLTNGDAFSLTTREHGEDFTIQFMIRWNERCYAYGMDPY